MTTTKVLVSALFLVCGARANAAVTFDWVTVGNPGNTGDVQPNGTFGAVDYIYRISKYEVTNSQYTEFLNAVDPAGTNAFALYSQEMSTDANGGINFNSGAVHGLKYQIKLGRGNNPVIFVNFRDAMRFVNWLHNGQGTGSTESGVYTIGTGSGETRDPGALYFMPSENEWYKSAYHKNDGATGNYWDYPTSTDLRPFSDQPPGNGAPVQSNTANYYNDDSLANGYNDGYAVTGSRIRNFSQNYLTDVGAYTESESAYGTFDQGGNVWEWNEGTGSLRGLRGDGWSPQGSDCLIAFNRFLTNPGFDYDNVGFRVASIPEPGTGLLALLGAVGLLLHRTANQPVVFSALCARAARHGASAKRSHG